MDLRLMPGKSRVKLLRLVVQTAGMMAVIGLALFLPAGPLAWPAAWVFLGLMVALSVGESIWLMRFDPDLLNERLGGIVRSDQEPWDKVLVGIIFAAFYAWLVLMGLDAVRFRWSHVPRPLQVIGALLLLASFRLFHAVFRENSFVSPAVRIQTERKQTVVTTGPYAHVRHPMYAGVVPYAIGTSLLLGSWSGILGAFLILGLVGRRAVLEERVLRERLEGYGAYM